LFDVKVHWIVLSFRYTAPDENSVLVADIERDWLAGGVIAVSPDDVVTAFERVEEVLGRPWIEASRENRGAVSRGTSPTLHVVTMGRNLAALSVIVRGRDELIAQLRSKNHAAFSELTAIWLLFSQEPRIIVELYPAVASGRVPDFRVRRNADELWTYVEVTAADTSETQRRATQVLERIAGVVHTVEGEFGLELFLRREPTDAEIAVIAGETLSASRRQSRTRKEPVVKQVTTYVGIDAHKKDLFIAMRIGGQPTPVTWQLPNEPNGIRRLVRKLEREAPGPVQACYEAGPCGYALQRQMTTARVSASWSTIICWRSIIWKPGSSNSMFA
jgi:hypothetical protein